MYPFIRVAMCFSIFFVCVCVSFFISLLLANSENKIEKLPECIASTFPASEEIIFLFGYNDLHIEYRENEIS